MGKLKAFVKLDLITVKPFFTMKNIMIYVAILVFMGFMLRNFTSASGIGMMLVTQNISYPFALGEKHNIDALYVTLGADRKTVVKGRYLFALLLNVCGMAFLAVFNLAAMAFTGSMANGGSILAEMGAILAVGTIFMLVQSTQIPIFFKLGYTKAKTFSIVPFFLLMAFISFFIVSAQGGGVPGAADAIIESIVNNIWAIVAAIAAILVIIVFVSYRFSIAFYGKREF